MKLELNGFSLELELLALRDDEWTRLPLRRENGLLAVENEGIRAELQLFPRTDDRTDYHLRFTSAYRTRLRLRLALRGGRELFHLIPGNIHGDNNAAHVQAGQFPVLSRRINGDVNAAPLWEFRADRASHPVSILCCSRGAVGISIDPYSECGGGSEGNIGNGVFAALPDSFGIALGYGNDPLTFVEKTNFEPPTRDLALSAECHGTLFAVQGRGRSAAHEIVREIYGQRREVPRFQKTFEQALRALTDAFASVSYSEELGQYTNRKCQVPGDTTLKPWRAIVEIGWTGGSMMGFPFALAERLLPDLKMPKGSRQIFDEICSGFNPASGLINDTCINRFTRNRPEGWNDSEINGWWSGFLPGTRDNHCAYTNGHAAYYLLRAASLEGEDQTMWVGTALRVLETAKSLQRADGAFGHIFSGIERKVVDFDGFAGCWFAAGMARAGLMGDKSFLDSARRALEYYHRFVRNLACWGSPMDTYKSIDSEGNLAFLRAARLMHEVTGDDRYVEMLADGAMYEYLWRYGFRTRPQCPPLRGSNWNSCGGTITSVSNPHIHPMSVVATDDLEYLAEVSGDDYHAQRAEDGMAWLMNTMELYPDVMGYGRYGVLSERTCPSDGLLVERYSDGTPASTWWSYNAWAAASAMEAIGVRLMKQRREAR